MRDELQGDPRDGSGKAPLGSQYRWQRLRHRRAPWCAHRLAMTRNEASVGGRFQRCHYRNRNDELQTKCMHPLHAPPECQVRRKEARRRCKPPADRSRNDLSAAGFIQPGASADGGGVDFFEWTFRGFCVKFRDFLTKAWPCPAAGPTRFGVCAPGPGQPVLRIPESDLSRPICTEHFR